MKRTPSVLHRCVRLATVGLLAGMAMSLPAEADTDETFLWSDCIPVTIYTNATGGWTQMKPTPLLSPTGMGTIRVPFSVSSDASGSVGTGCGLGFSANALIKVDILNAQNIVVANNTGAAHRLKKRRANFLSLRTARNFGYASRPQAESIRFAKLIKTTFTITKCTFRDVHHRLRPFPRPRHQWDQHRAIPDLVMYISQAARHRVWDIRLNIKSIGAMGSSRRG